MYYLLFKEGKFIKEGWKIKRRWKYGVGAGLLKRERDAGTFPIQFFQSLSFLPLEITLSFAKSCYAFEKKKKISATIIL